MEKTGNSWEGWQGLEALWRFLPFLNQQGSGNARKSLLIALLAVALTIIALSVYANGVECIMGCSDGNEACRAKCLDTEAYVIIESADGYCEIECGSDLECDDNNASTTDICSNDGTCQSSCVNIEEQPPCGIICGTDQECDDNDANTMDVCENKGTCDSYCTSVQGIPECTIICNNDAECNDNNASTTDICSNDGTCRAKCANIKEEAEAYVIIESVDDYCEIECSSDQNCDDQNPETADACKNKETCQAECTHVQKGTGEINKESKDNGKKYGDYLKKYKTLVPEESFGKEFFRKEKGIFIDTTAKGKKFKGSDIPIKWGYENETIEVPYKEAYMPFWFEHSFSTPINPCDGTLGFISSYAGDSIEFQWEYDVEIPNYVEGEESGKCGKIIDETSCHLEETMEEGVQLCDVSLVDGICTWKALVPDGTYTYEKRSRWRPLEELENCPLQPNKRYWFRHAAAIPVGSTIVFDVNAIFDLPTIGRFAFTIPKPAWISTAASDFNTGTGFDFNYTKVTWDGNVMPVGDDKIHNDQNRVFYDQNLLLYYRMNDLNSTGALINDTNYVYYNKIMGTGTIAKWGLWDTNAYYTAGSGNSVDTSFNGSDLNEISITMWVKSEVVGSTRYLADNSIGTNGFGLRHVAAQIDFFTYVGGVSTTASKASILDGNRWHHIAGVHDTTTNKVYFDGMLVATQALSAGTGMDYSAATMNIGGDCENTGGFLGSIDEFKFYSRALTANEIQLDYNGWMDSDYLSPIKDAGAAVNWDAMDWNAFVDVNNNVTVDYRGCSTANCSSAGAWQTNLRAVAGTWNTDIRADNNRYFQYRVNFDTNKQMWNITRSPQLSLGDKGAHGHFSNAVVTYSSSNTVPDANIWQVDTKDFNAALPSFRYGADGNLAIKFRVADADGDDLNFNMWYGTSSGGKTNKIIGDINLSTNAGFGSCDTNSKSGMVCSYDWNISGIADANYWITIEINDGTDTNTIGSERSFRVNPTPPKMQVKYGSFAKPNSTTGNQATIGVGFQPKLVIFFGNYRTADGSDANATEFFGAATSSTHRAAMASTSQDAVGTSACDKRWSNALVITQISAPTPIVNAEADFVSMDPDGFTINWTTNDTSQGIINYIAFGGDDLTNVDVNSFKGPLAAGDTVISDVGFKPDALIIFDNSVTTTPASAGNAASSAFNIGFVVGTTKQNSRSTMRQDAQAAANTWGYQRTNSCQNSVSGAGLVNVRAATIKSMDSNGFTLTFAGSLGTAVFISYIALKGGQYDTGSFNEATSTGNQSVTTGFTPSGVIFQSAGNATSAVVSSLSRISFGVGISSSERASIWSGDLDGADPMRADSDLNRERALRFLMEGTPTLLADLDFVSNDATGFTINNTMVDGNAREILYFAIGAAAAVTTVPDANVKYPMKGESFDKVSVSTVDINVSVQDNDTNTFTMAIDINYSASATQGTGTVIINDVNLATLKCDSNNLKTAQECKYTWNISSVPSGNYYILATVSDGTNSDFNSGASTFTITTSNQGPDANVVYPENDENFNRDITTTIDINVSVKDIDNNTFDLNIDLNYSASQTQGTGTVIINDVNLATLNCDSNDLKTTRYCKYNWNISSMQAGNYYILTTVNDSYNTDFNAGEKDFNIWCTGSWPYRMKLTFRNAMQTIDMHNFPVMVKLDSARIDYSKVGKPNGGDLRFSDPDGSTLSYEIEDWNTVGESVIWVRVPNIPANSTTDYINMEYGNPCATDGNNNASVWDGNYRAVYHFAEQDGNYFDSTANNNDSNLVRITARGNVDENSLGHYPLFVPVTNQNGDHVGVPDSNSLNLETSDFTISVRAKVPTGTTLTDSDMIRKGSSGTSTDSWWKLEWGDDTTPNSIHANLRPAGVDYHSNYTKVPDSLWHDVATVRNNTDKNYSLYLDGNRVVGPTTGADGNVTNNSNMGIGSKDTYNDDHFDGCLDEVRIQGIARDGNWLRAERYSFDDNFITYNALPDATIWKVDNTDFNAALPSFSYAADGNLAIKFRATDQDNDDLNFNMWYGTTHEGKTNKIIGDINLSTNAGFGGCDTNSKSGMVCSYDWNISGIADANYWITIEINDGTDTNTIGSERSFRVNPSAGDSCSCPGTGHWEIINGDKCTLATECNLSAGDLHIVNGSLTIVSGGTLAVPTGKKIIVEKAANTKLVVQSGGKVKMYK